MANLSWEISVFISRWRNRMHYLLRMPGAYRNWWSAFLPKLGISVVLELRRGPRYLVRAKSTDLSVLNEMFLMNPYLGSGYVSLPPNGVVVDVGANMGDFAMQAAAICSHGLVIAVEPMSKDVRQIELNRLLNGFDHVRIAHLALGNCEGQIEIHSQGAQSSAFWGEGATERVRLTTLGKLMSEMSIDHVDVLKMDCEGAEWQILPAAEDVLPRIRQICMEFHCAEGWTQEKLAGWLRERGYRVKHTPGTWNGFLWAWRPGGSA